MTLYLKVTTAYSIVSIARFEVLTAINTVLFRYAMLCSLAYKHHVFEGLYVPFSGQNGLTNSSTMKRDASGFYEVMVFINQTTKGHVPAIIILYSKFLYTEQPGFL